jgi:hypothetical protein
VGRQMASTWGVHLIETKGDMGKGAGEPGEPTVRGGAVGERGPWEAFAGFSPQSRVQPRQGKVFGAIVMPYCTLYRSNRSKFDSFNVRWVTLIGWDY